MALVYKGYEQLKLHPFGTLFVLLFIFHFCFIGAPVRDDLDKVFFAADYMEMGDGSFFSAVVVRWNMWSSRFVADWITYFFVHGHFLFFVSEALLSSKYSFLIFSASSISFFGVF